jgi:hypothetical protein
MEDASLQFNLGSVGARFGELKFSFLVFNNGNAHLTDDLIGRLLAQNQMKQLVVAS